MIQKRESGNILFYILLVVFMLGMLTYYISQTSTQQSGALGQQTIDNQINQMVTYAAGLGGALQQMVVNGENPNTLYTTLDAQPPSADMNYSTPPNNLKLFHPMGGGITYESQSAPNLPVATNYSINAASIINGLGCTAASGVGCVPTAGHIIFTATMTASNYCAEVNKKLNGSNTVPTMNATAFSKLFGGTTVTIDNVACASCVGVSRQCVTDGSGNYGFYADLFPPQNSNAN